MSDKYEHPKKKNTAEKPAGMVMFKTNCAWSGDRGVDADGKVTSAAFNLEPGDTCQLPRATAEAREAAGLGTIVEDDE